MKILHVITSLRIGGAEKLLVDMVPLFKAKGIIVDVLVFDGIDTHLKKKLIDSGVKVICLSNNSMYNPLFIFKLIPIIKQYEIIHTHNTACQYYVALAKLLSFSKTKLITTEHSTNNRRRENFLFFLLDKLIYGTYKKIISISEDATKNFIKHIGFKYKITTISNGVNLADFTEIIPASVTDLYFCDNSTILIMISAFRVEKDHETLIKSMKHLPYKYKLLLVGDGERRSICEEFVKSLNLEDRILFLGNRNDVPKLLRLSNIGILSSHWEGFGLAAVEAMAANIPVVASDVPGLREVVEGAGVLFPQGDAKKLAEIVEKLMTDKELYDQTAANCLTRAANFDINITVDEYIEVYNSVSNE